MSELKTLYAEAVESNSLPIDHSKEDQSLEAVDTALATIEEIFARRAAQLAQVPEAESESERKPLALFWLGQEIYAVEAEYVIEVRPAKNITRVPRVPKWIAGVVNLRGRILSVMKLDAFFGISTGSMIADSQNGQEETEKNPYLVVVQSQDLELAFLVDAIITVDDFIETHIRQDSNSVYGIPQEYVLGVMDYESHNLINDETKTMPVAVLDLPTLLVDEKLIIREEII